MTKTADPLLLEDGMVLTDWELYILKLMLSHGDRAGFYATYQAMTSNLDSEQSGSTEAALQSKISTFSDDVGAIAYYSNALLQESLTTSNYAGIYHLSQEVATNAHAYMMRDFTMGGGSPSEEVDGILNREVFFSSAQNAWEQNRELDHFPGNLLSSGYLEMVRQPINALWNYIGDIVANGGIPDRSDVIDFINEDDGAYAGIRASALALLYVVGIVGESGKRVSQYSNNTRYSQVQSPDGYLEYVVDTQLNKVVAVGDVGIGYTQTSHEMLLESGLVLVGLLAPAVVGVHQLLDTVFGVYSPANDDWTLFTESTDPLEFDGDYNTGAQENDFTSATFYSTLRDTASTGNDVLFGTSGSDVINGGEGSDLIIGGAGDDQLSAGIWGADILWGQDGNDTLIGGSGDGTYRGGNGNDVIYADGLDGSMGGNDTVIGGAGDDLIYSSYVGDILIGNTGDDRFYLQDSNGIVPEMPEPEYPIYPTVVWGGEGNDEYHISADTSVVFIYADDVSTKDFLTLNFDGFAQETARTFPDADVIIVNPEITDKFYIGDNLVSNLIAQPQVSVNEWGSGGDFYRTGDYNGYPLYVPSTYTQFRMEQTTYSYMFDGEPVDLYTTASEWYGTYSTDSYGYFSSLHFSSGNVSIYGFVGGAAGVTFSGSPVTWSSYDISTTYDLASYDIDYYHWDSVYEEYWVIVKNPVFSGSPIIDEDRYQSTTHLMPENYTLSVQDTIDFAKYRWTYILDPVPDTVVTPNDNLPTPQDDFILLDDSDTHSVDAGDGDDVVITGSGDDYIAGGLGNDSLFGNHGDDVIFGEAGDDGLAGGRGNDYLDGSEGSDFYLWAEGDGNDVIVDSGSAIDSDMLRFLNGISHNDLGVSRSGDDLVLTVLGNEQITIVDQFLGDGIESISFDAGPTWDRAYFESLVDGGPSTEPWIANDDRFWTAAETSVVVDFTANDVIPSGANVEAYIWGNPQHGQISWNGTEHVYIPDTGFTGVDWFSYGLEDADNNGELMTPDGAFVVVHVGQTYDPNDHTGITDNVGTGNGSYFGGSSFDDTVYFTGGDSGVSGDGKDGDDIVIFDGNISDYEIVGQGEYFTIHNTTTDDSFQFTNMEYIRFNGTAAISLADIVANSNYDPGDTWYEPEPIGGLV